MRIYIEESGDLGFSERSSKFFVIGAVIAPDEACITHCFKKVRKTLGKTKKNAPEIKSYNTDDVIKRRVYKCISKCDAKFAYLLLRKEQVFKDLREKKPILYNYLIGSLILKILQEFKRDDITEIVLDKSEYSYTREHFNEYLADKMLCTGYYDLGSIDLLTILHTDSRGCPGIQVADFIAGGVFRYYRDNDDTFYSSYIDKKTVIALDFYNGRLK